MLVKQLQNWNNAMNARVKDQSHKNLSLLPGKQKTSKFREHDLSALKYISHFNWALLPSTVFSTIY